MDFYTLRFSNVILLTIGMACMCNYCSGTQKTTATWTKGPLLFKDSGKKNWQSKWMLDGQRSQVIHSESGMELIAGPEHGNDTCHTVLWTKQDFSGDLCIEYEYTRTDTTTRAVNILYFLATGEGSPEYPQDIALWNDKRVVPHMRTYFNHMHTYHISYAAFPAHEYSTQDYIRLRRYNPEEGGLKDTNVPGEYTNTGLFKTGVTYSIRVVKLGQRITMDIQNIEDPKDQLSGQWDVSMMPDCTQGRIGLRHMYTRSARYRNFKVWQIEM